MRIRPKQKLIDTATGLFSEYGFHATGINRILKESGVAKKTLYHHFPSKDDLIAAVLEEYAENAQRYFREELETRSEVAVERLYIYFDLAFSWFEKDTFFGCIFVNAINEFSEKDSPIRAVCVNYKTTMRLYIRELCENAGVQNSNKLGDQLFMLFEGATVMAQITDDSSYANLAKETARQLISTNSH